MPDERFGRAVLLRDLDGITSATALLPPQVVPIVSRFTGAFGVEEIARQASRDLGSEVPVEFVERLVMELDRGFFLDSPRYRAERARVEKAFAESPIRPASHAGGAYHDEPAELRRYLDEACLARGRASASSAPLAALIAPHIDPWRGAVGYGHAYAALRACLPAEVDTFVLLGTSHAPMKEPFALCRKGFETPLGILEPDLVAIDALAKAARFDPYADLFNHKREHSIELQAIFVRHLLGERPIKIIPILCGLGEEQRTGSDPARDARVESWLEALRRLCDERRGRVAVVAGADLAHVGPRFGDPEPYDVAARGKLEERDRASLALAEQNEPAAFFEHVQQDLDTRRVCGLGPIYTLLRLLPSGARGELLHYEQTIDPEEGSIVSHAAMAFFG